MTGIFNIDPDSGQVILNKTLDREVNDQHTLLVNVRDKGSPPLSASTNLSIVVQDVNDELPRFQQTTVYSPTEVTWIDLIYSLISYICVYLFTSFFLVMLYFFIAISVALPRTVLSYH